MMLLLLYTEANNRRIDLSFWVGSRVCKMILYDEMLGYVSLSACIKPAQERDTKTGRKEEYMGASCYLPLVDAYFVNEQQSVSVCTILGGNLIIPLDSFPRCLFF